ncbi:hypothetical protein [Halonatronum saccharophilum]|uniref:hypothetical protein n=1 Tax=Halonatronum saccharophilum TaxID=150060 RepID=UPI00316AE5C4
MAKFGYLFLNKGYWEGEEVVPESWVSRSTKKHTYAEGWAAPGYGYQWWATEYGYYASGMGEQNIMVIPESDMVIVTSGKYNEYNRVYNRVYTLLSHIRNAVKDDQAIEENLQASRELEERINDIKNPQPQEVISLPQKAAQISGNFYRLELNDLGIEGIRLDFEDESTAYLRLIGPSIDDDVIPWIPDDVIEIGLDGIYRKTEITTEYRAYLHDLNVDVVAAKGEWSGENTFNLEFREMGNFKYNFSLMFFDNKLTGTLDTAPLNISEFLTGEVEN